MPGGVGGARASLASTRLIRSTSWRIVAVATPNEFELFADRFCGPRGHLTTESGAALGLEPFQRVVLADFFAGASETAILVPKGNGKSTLMAALGLFVLVTTRDAEIALAAASRDQAALIHRQAAGMIRRSGWLTARLRPTLREVRSRRHGGVLRVLASDTDTIDGWLGDLAVIDELHRHRDIGVYGVLRDGAAKRNGRTITISTAGDDEESPLGKIRQAAHRLEDQVTDGAYRCCRSPNRQFVFHEWALDADQDRENMEIVKTANPASWITPESLQAAHDSPSMTPWGWARFRCGIWERGEDSAIRPQEWDALAVPGLTIPDGAEVWIGLDLGWKLDCTAIVPMHVAGERRIVAGSIILQPPDDGGMLDELLIEEALIGLHRRFKVLGVIYDPHAGAQQLAQRLERERKVTFIEHSQDSSPMALAASRLMEAIRTKQLVHDGDRVLRSHVLNAAQRTVSGERWKFDRPRRGARLPIDALTALSMVNSVATDPPKKKQPSVLQFSGEYAGAFDLMPEPF